MPKSTLTGSPGAKTLKRAPIGAVAQLRGLLARLKQAMSVEAMDAGVAAHLKHKHRPGKNER